VRVDKQQPLLWLTHCIDYMDVLGTCV